MPAAPGLPLVVPGMPARSLDLARELQTAYEHELAQQRKSARNLLLKIASLCEREEYSGLAMAKALRELEDVHSVGPSLPRDEGKEDPLPLPQSEATPQSSNGNMVSLDPVDNVSALVNKEIANDLLHAAKQDPMNVEGRAERTSSGDFQDVDASGMDEMKQAFDIPKCDFIEANGKINPLPSDFEVMTGGFFVNLYENINHGWCQPMEPERWVVRFALSGAFKGTSSIVILLNFFFIICKSDYKLWALMEKRTELEAAWMSIMEVAFLVFYSVEVIVRVIALRKEFFLGPDMSWNWFDFLIVLTGVTEIIIASFGGSAANLSFLRVMRFFKISRILRMFTTLRLVKDVKVMVDVLIGSFVTFSFGCMLMAMFLCVFAIFFVQGLSSFVEGELELDPALRDSILLDFQCVAVAMRSLFYSITGGEDWARYHDTMKALGPVYDYLYLFFMAFTIIAFTNVITGVFAEKAMRLASPSMEELACRRRGKEIEDAEELVALFDREAKALVFQGKDGKPSISVHAFDDFMSHPAVVSFFEARGLEATTAHRFFTQLLDINQADKMDIGTFISACVKLDGQASSIDLHVVSVEMKLVVMQQHQLLKTLNDSVRRTTAAVAKQLSEFCQGLPPTNTTAFALPTFPDAVSAITPALRCPLPGTPVIGNTSVEDPPVVLLL